MAEVSGAVRYFSLCYFGHLQKCVYGKQYVELNFSVRTLLYFKCSGDLQQEKVMLPIDWHYAGPVWRREAEFVSRKYFPSMLLEAQATICFLFLETGLLLLMYLAFTEHLTH